MRKNNKTGSVKHMRKIYFKGTEEMRNKGTQDDNTANKHKKIN